MPCRFKGGADGAIPAADLIIDAKGALYGTITTGGGGRCSGGCGSVFELTLPAAGETRLTEKVLAKDI